MKTAETLNVRANTVTIEDVVKYIKEQVKFGLLVPGHRLVEIDLMNITNASRGHVREALKRLAVEGYVQIEPYKGASIKKLTRTEVIEIYQLREALEGLAARLTGQTKLTNAQKSQLIKIQDSLDKATQTENHEEFRKANDAYHSFIRTASGNTYLEIHLERLHFPIFQLQFRMFFDNKDLNVANADHVLITKAILEGDAATAEKVMRKHISGGMKTILAMDDRYFAS